MHALKWVQDSQNGRDEVWDYQDMLSQVKESLEQSRQKGRGGWDVGLRGHLKLSRAVRVVNGQYGDMTNIPRVFAEVLYWGSKFASGGPFTRTCPGAAGVVGTRLGAQIHPRSSAKSPVGST